VTPNRRIPWLLLAIVAVGGWMAWPRQHALPAAGGHEVAESRPVAAAPVRQAVEAAPQPDSQGGAVLPAFLPAEARATIVRIQRAGPFPHRQDGGVFGNREGHLPRKPRGWYREYTVETPGLRHRGARRIVTGGDPPREWYYTDDHYDSFRSVAVMGNLQ
jgi:ribonuclease T1